ncbi:hypothetical protein B0B36_16680 [Pseudomonas syringae pv. actinidifoliorum]|nr:hypothetical protein B0B36_16680 [Pseudomonas syringae pv. actinidifoliorum]
MVYSIENWFTPHLHTPTGPVGHAPSQTDFGEIVPARYIYRFKQVFVKTGFEEHYVKMIGLCGASSTLGGVTVLFASNIGSRCLRQSPGNPCGISLCHAFLSV